MIKYCENCNIPFETESRQRLCMVCILDRKKENQSYKQMQRKKLEPIKKRKTYRPPEKTLNQVCEELKEYNKAHKCNLSYGQWVSGMR